MATGDRRKTVTSFWRGKNAAEKFHDSATHAQREASRSAHVPPQTFALRGDAAGKTHSI